MCCKDLHELLLHLIRSDILLSDNKVVGYERYNLAAQEVGKTTSSDHL